MSSVKVIIGGRECQVACDDGQEEHLKKLAKLLDERLKGLGSGTGRNEAQLMMLAALMLTDETEDQKRELSQVRSEVRYTSQSFETNKQIEMEGAIAATIHDIAARVEAIASELEKAS